MEHGPSPGRWFWAASRHRLGQRSLPCDALHEKYKCQDRHTVAILTSRQQERILNLLDCGLDSKTLARYDRLIDGRQTLFSEEHFKWNSKTLSRPGSWARSWPIAAAAGFLYCMRCWGLVSTTT